MGVGERWRSHLTQSASFPSKTRREDTYPPSSPPKEWEELYRGGGRRGEGKGPQKERKRGERRRRRGGEEGVVLSSLTHSTGKGKDVWPVEESI